MKWKEGGQFENPPAGEHIARCFQLIDLGTQLHSFGGETWSCRDVRITFELPMCRMAGKYNAEVKGKPFAVSKAFKQSLHTASALRPFLESWRGKKFTKEEIAAYDPRRLVGAPCKITLIENGDFVNIDHISRINAADCPAAINEPVFISLERGEFDKAAFSKLSEKLQEKIKNSPEYKALMAPEPAEHDNEPPHAAPFDDTPF